ncbi:heterokaryon incompatibility protein-domain-containing protein [Pisolithus tinctorius]|nr:heterokaryon incompatibility protein-domain-containing protein [Pisolithus tinctorius]
MKLLDVEAVLDRERDIQKTDPNREILKELDDKDSCYAILSHRWGVEVGYEEMTGLMRMGEEDRKEVRERYGYQKIIKSCEQAKKDGYEWLWVDTCCIDKRSSSELSEAINSMYRWYRNAQVCYAYLNDVDEEVFPKFDKSNGWPEWFELIAPKQVEFFNKNWVSIGNKRRLALALKDITKIQTDVVMDGLAGKCLSVARIMSWAADRKTTRVEDRAYSLMGLFGVNMPMLYGEGEKAFQRLQLEIIRTSSDHSIFAWNPRRPRTGSVLADDPSDFRGCGNMTKMEPGEFVDNLARYIRGNRLGNPRYIFRDSIEVPTNPIHRCRLAWLRWRARSLSQSLRTFAVSNAGIQMCLPVIPSPNSPPIDLVFSGSSFDRTSRAGIPTAFPECQRDASRIYTRRQACLVPWIHPLRHLPRKFPGNTVTLPSLTDDLLVIVYANDDVKSRFAVGLGYYLRQGWVHVVYDDQEADWAAFAKNAHDRMWKARAKHAQSMPERLDNPNSDREDHFIKHAHLPRSTWGVKVAWGRWGTGNFKVMVDHTRRGIDTPGLMHTDCYRYRYKLDGWLTWLDGCFGQRVALGDYGDYSNGNFKCTGNIFEDARTLGVDPYELKWSNRADDPATYCRNGKYVALRQPKGLSLPTNEHLVLLMKSLSIPCCRQTFGFHGDDDNGKQGDSGDPSDSGNHSTEPQVFTLLYTATSPQVWQRKPFFEERRKQFHSIREHFYSLMNMDQSRGPDAGHKSVNRQKTDRTIKFFSDIFGFPLLSNYVGKITFFERLPWMMETNPRSECSVGNVEAHGLQAHLFKGTRQSNAAQDPRLEVMISAPRRSADEKQKVVREFESFSRTPSAGLLKYIVIALAYHHYGWSRPSRGIEYDRHFNTPSMIQEIEALQAKLSATEDEDEQRALEEDVTGKILWLCWCGICTEVDELLPKVVDYIPRVIYPRGLYEIYLAMASLTDPDDDHAHLQRIMFDAGAGTSKHQLLLDARAAEQAKWSSTTTSRDITNTNTQGPSTSSQSPSTSAV